MDQGQRFPVDSRHGSRAVWVLLGMVVLLTAGIVWGMMKLVYG